MNQDEWLQQFWNAAMNDLPEVACERFKSAATGRPVAFEHTIVQFSPKSDRLSVRMFENLPDASGTAIGGDASSWSFERDAAAAGREFARHFLQVARRYGEQF